MTGPNPRTVALVLDRDGGCCVVCGAGIYGDRGYDWSIQHRRPRGMGGTRRGDANSPANLVTVCGSATTGCHSRIESHRADAVCSGWLVPQYADPAATPVLIYGERWRYLTGDGTYSTDPPEVNA